MIKVNKTNYLNVSNEFVKTKGKSNFADWVSFMNGLARKEGGTITFDSGITGKDLNGFFGTSMELGRLLASNDQVATLISIIENLPNGKQRLADAVLGFLKSNSCGREDCNHCGDS